MIDVQRVALLLGKLRPGPYWDGVFLLRGIKSEQIDSNLTGRAQSATCAFCHKTVCSWPARVANKRGAVRTWKSPEHQKLSAAVDKHVQPCAERWLLALLCRWSTKVATPEEHNAVVWWKHKHMAITPDEIRIATENYGMWAHHNIAPPYMANIFDNLPQPVSSEFVTHLEILLHLHHRLVELGMRARAEAEETFVREAQARSTISG